MMQPDEHTFEKPNIDSKATVEVIGRFNVGPHLVGRVCLENFARAENERPPPELWRRVPMILCDS
jgi:hypothetical protein